MTESLQRWAAKKAARASVAAASALSGSIAIRSVVGGPKVRALTYHRFGADARDPWCVAPDAFESQMAWLARRGLAVTLDDALRFARGECQLRDGSVLVTIDDGFRSVLSVAAPVLRRYAVPAVAYVTTSFLDNSEAGKRAGQPYLTWAELEALQAAGVTIGSHGHRHRSMARLPIEEAEDEARRSKALLEAHLGQPVRSFAYPYGMRRDESASTAAVLAGCGYDSVFISQHGTIWPGADPMRLHRIKVEGGESLTMFKLLCRGAMDVWNLADRLL